MSVMRVIAAILISAASFGSSTVAADAAPKLVGGCAGGHLKWSAPPGQKVTQAPRLLNFSFSGDLSGCNLSNKAVSARVTGTQSLRVSCAQGAMSVATLTINWNNGKSSTVQGLSRTSVMGPVTDTMKVTTGDGSGQELSLVKNFVVNENIMHQCLVAGGVPSGDINISNIQFR